MARGLTPVEMLIDKAGLRCTVCAAKMGECDCWSQCECGWSYRKGGRCGNPIHVPAPTPRRRK